MRTNKTLLLLAFSCILSLTNCKKGAEDPFLSLRSRKARVCGDWDMKSGKVISSYSDSNGSVTVSGTSSYTMNESTYTSTYTDNGFTTSSSGSCKMTMKFEKDGAFEMIRILDGTSYTAKGTWNFTGKVGETKNKEQIVMHFTSQTDPGTTATHSGNYTDMTFNIKELRNKKMVIISEYSDMYSDGYKSTGLEEYTLEQ